MVVRRDIFDARAYLSRATRRLEKQRALIRRSQSAQTVALARDLMKLLVTLRSNVQRQHDRLQKMDRRSKHLFQASLEG